MITVDDFHKAYEKTVAVSGISFDVAGGEILGLVGPNGAGKTTTLKTLSCVIPPTRGRLTAHGYDVEGPLPADTLFIKAKEGRWDAVVAMYHDQGNIPVKLLAFGNIVNVTLGLPIIRTSVDHGTAFDIAGRGIASESSLVTALKFAASLWKRK